MMISAAILYHSKLIYNKTHIFNYVFWKMTTIQSYTIVGLPNYVSIH